MAGHVGPLLGAAHGLQRHVRNAQHGAAGPHGRHLHAGLRVEHQLAVAVQPHHGGQRRAPRRDQLDAAARHTDRRPERGAGAARLELQRRAADRGHPPLVRRHLVRRPAARGGLPHHPLRQGPLRRSGHPGRGPAPLGLRGQHRRPRGGRSGQLPRRAQLRQPHRRAAAVALRRAGAGEVLGFDDLRHRSPHAGGDPRSGQGPPLRAAVVPLHGPLRHPHTHRPRRPFLR